MPRYAMLRPMAWVVPPRDATVWVSQGWADRG
jgi:hypothetical protein